MSLSAMISRLPFRSLVVLLMWLIPATACIAVEPWIYFADNDAHTINRIRFDGGGFEVLAETEEVLLGLTVDKTLRKMYWSDNPAGGSARLHRADLDGTNAEVVYEAIVPFQGETVGQLALSEAAQHIYWIDSGAGRIRQMDLSGLGITNVLEDEDALADALELDAEEGKLYFTTGTFGASTAKVERINLDGTGREVLADTYAQSLFLDLEGNRVLGADWEQHAIFELPANGYARNDLFSVGSPRDVQRYEDMLVYNQLSRTSLAGENGFFMWIVRSNLDGSDPVVLRETNRISEPTDPIAFFIVVPEPASLWHVVCAMLCLCSLSNRGRDHIFDDGGKWNGDRRSRLS